MSRPWKHAYSGEVLRQVLDEVLGSRLLGESHKRLVIPSWDVQRGEVHLFKTPHHERLRRDWQIPMVDVAMATTAAPTYFPAARVDGQRLVDGGVWANNPSVVAIGEAVSMLDVPLHCIRVLNVGTVDQRNPPPEALRHRRLGDLGHHRHAVDAHGVQPRRARHRDAPGRRPQLRPLRRDRARGRLHAGPRRCRRSRRPSRRTEPSAQPHLLRVVRRALAQTPIPQFTARTSAAVAHRQEANT